MTNIEAHRWAKPIIGISESNFGKTEDEPAPGQLTSDETSKDEEHAEGTSKRSHRRSEDDDKRSVLMINLRQVWSSKSSRTSEAAQCFHLGRYWAFRAFANRR